MLQNLQQLGYERMTAIQAASLPHALLGRDLIAQAQTGSGKTAAFALPLLTNLNPRRFAVQALVLCPTRELADQVSVEIRRLARAEDNIKLVTLCGGVPLRGQAASLEHGAHIVVGTPGRVMDHLDRGSLDLDALNTWVLDEADRMLDMGFYDDIVRVAQRCPAQRQTLLFSATYPEGIAKLAERFMRDPQTIRVEATASAGRIRQCFYEVQDNERLHAVGQLLRHFRPASALAFCNTKQQCRDLAAVLQGEGFSALTLFGELEQRERDQVLLQFANRSATVLVATDVAARGLDISSLAAVIDQRGRDRRRRGARAPHRAHRPLGSERRGRGRRGFGLELGQFGRDGPCGPHRAAHGPRGDVGGFGRVARRTRWAAVAAHADPANPGRAQRKNSRG